MRRKMTNLSAALLGATVAASTLVSCGNEQKADAAGHFFTLHTSNPEKKNSDARLFPKETCAGGVHFFRSLGKAGGHSVGRSRSPAGKQPRTF